MKDLKKEHLILLRQRAWLSLKDSHALEIEPRTVSTKIDILAFADHLHPISKILSIGTLQGFLLKYVTLSQLNRLKRYEPSKFEVSKKGAIYLIKWPFFDTSNFEGSYLLSLLSQEKVIYFKRKPYNVIIERIFEIGCK